MQIPLIDLVAQYQSIRREVDQAIAGVLESGVFILGRHVEAFEDAMATYLGVRFGIGVASGTDALFLTLRALGIGPRDEVIVPAFTFFATAEVVSHLGATPIFVDIDPHTYCLDAENLEAAITPRAKAIIPVHLYGHPAEMRPILDIAHRRGIYVVEDNAQAIGAEYEGRKTGSLGDAGCLSFYPSKNLGGYGDGGMIVTNDEAIAGTLRKIRTHGWQRKYHPNELGWNSRLDELQAAVLLAKLGRLDGWNERRRSIARKYQIYLADVAVNLPHEAAYARHVYHLYVLRVRERDRVQAHLRSLGIASGIYYPLPLHLLRPYRHRGYAPGTFPHAERASEETLAIPLYPEITDNDVEQVASAVREAVATMGALEGGV